MKLTAGRKKDLSDIGVLVEKCFSAGIFEEAVQQRFEYLYGGRVSMKPAAVKAMRLQYKQCIKGSRR